jgi:hypothetical protein
LPVFVTLHPIKKSTFTAQDYGKQSYGKGKGQDYGKQSYGKGQDYGKQSYGKGQVSARACVLICL